MPECLKYRKKENQFITDEEMLNYEDILSQNLDILGLKKYKTQNQKFLNKKFPGKIIEIDYKGSLASVVCDLKENLETPGFMESNPYGLYHLGIKVHSESSSFGKTIKKGLESAFENCKELEKVN